MVSSFYTEPISIYMTIYILKKKIFNKTILKKSQSDFVYLLYYYIFLNIYKPPVLEMCLQSLF